MSTRTTWSSRAWNATVEVERTMIPREENPILTEEEKAKVTEAVRELRLALGESQQAFAERLKASVRSVARYETVRPPRGRPLAQLRSIAEEEGLNGIAAVLDEALTQELYGARELYSDGGDLPERFDKVSPRT